MTGATVSPEVISSAFSVSPSVAKMNFTLLVAVFRLATAVDAGVSLRSDGLGLLGVL